MALSRVANFSVTEDSYYAEDADADATAGAGGGGGGGGGGGVVATLQYPPTSAADVSNAITRLLRGGFWSQSKD